MAKCAAFVGLADMLQISAGWEITAAAWTWSLFPSRRKIWICRYGFGLWSMLCPPIGVHCFGCAELDIPGKATLGIEIVYAKKP